MESPTRVYIVWHSREVGDDDEDSKLLGVYSARKLAEARISRARSQPGFRDHPDGYSVDRYDLDTDYCTEGFITD